MKKYWLLIAVVGFFLQSTVLSAQTVAPGWRISGDIKASSSLDGAWDIIADLDLDHDGNKELIFTKDPVASGFANDPRAAQSVYYYESTGDDTFEQRWSFTAPVGNQALNIYTAIKIGDLDQGGAPELYFGTPLSPADAPPNPRGLYVFEFDGSNFPTTPTETWNMRRPDNSVFMFAGMDIGDIDSDGEMELVICSRGPDDGAPGTSGRTLIVANSGGVDIGFGLGAFAIEFENSSNQEGGSLYNARIVDFDGDGKKEIWAFTWDYWSLAIYEATAPNKYELQVDMNRLFENQGIDYGNRRGMQFFDADGDGNLEFYQSGINADGQPDSYVFYIANTTDVSTLSPADVIRMGGKDLPYAGSAVGDLDGDGLMDFLFVGRNPFDSGGKVYRMEYKGSGALDLESSYEFTTLYEQDPPTDLRNIAISDFDGDGKTEILLTQLDAKSTNDPIVIVLESENPVSVQRTTGFVENFTLQQNFPNPFNPTTTIHFDMKSSEHVTLAVFNVLGEKVVTLVDNRLPVGAHKVDFVGAGLNTGVYYYTFEAGNTRITRQMLLLK